MRQSDAAAALAILCGTLLGAELFRQLNPSQELAPAPRVRVVEVSVEPQDPEEMPVVSEETSEVTLRVTSTDPDRQARFRMVLEDYPEGEATEVETPFTLTSTRSAIAGRLSVHEGDPDIRAAVTVERRGLHPSQTIAVSGDQLWVDSEGMAGGSLPDGR